MSNATFRLTSVLALLAAAPSWSQQPPAPPAAQPAAATPAPQVPRPDQLEPGVDTSATPSPPGAASESSRTSAPATPGAGASSSAKKAAKASTAAKPSADANTAAGTATQAKAPGKALDRLELDTTQITGNRELPKVLYIVPWKRSDLGDLVGKPPNSLLDEVLAPVDRDVFKRENRYYTALKPDAAGAGTPAAGAPGAAPATGAAPEGGGKP